MQTFGLSISISLSLYLCACNPINAIASHVENNNFRLFFFPFLSHSLVSEYFNVRKLFLLFACQLYCSSFLEKSSNNGTHTHMEWKKNEFVSHRRSTSTLIEFHSLFMCFSLAGIFVLFYPRHISEHRCVVYHLKMFA